MIFYVFYTLKGWKKIIVAQGPRQIIAGFTVYALLRSAWTKQGMVSENAPTPLKRLTDYCNQDTFNFQSILTTMVATGSSVQRLFL